MDHKTRSCNITRLWSLTCNDEIFTCLNANILNNKIYLISNEILSIALHNVTHVDLYNAGNCTAFTYPRFQGISWVFHRLFFRRKTVGQVNKYLSIYYCQHKHVTRFKNQPPSIWKIWLRFSVQACQMHKCHKTHNQCKFSEVRTSST